MVEFARAAPPPHLERTKRGIAEDGVTKRGTIKDYDAGTHTATVGIAGSLGVWLEAVPVHMGVRPSDVDAGRECAVLFLTDDNPKDAVVVSVHGGVPDTISAVTTLIKDADEDTGIESEQSADEDKLRHSVAGTLRYVIQDTSIHHQFAGDAYFDSEVHVGDGTSGIGWLNVYKVLGTITASPQAMLYMQESATFDANGLSADVLTAVPTVTINSGKSGAIVRGLNFFATFTGAGSLSEATAAQLRLGIVGNGSHNNAHGLYINSVFNIGWTGTFAAIWGARIQNQGVSGAALIYGIDIEEITAGTARRPLWERGSLDDDASGNRLYSNTALGTLATSGLFGGGDGVLHIHNARTNPSSDPTSGGILYVDSGALKYRGSGGTVTTLAAA